MIFRFNRTSGYYKEMWKLFLVSTFFVCVSCSGDVYTTDAYGFEILRNVHDFDLLIFTQQWPATACKEWKKHDPSHTCSMPTQADTWTIHGIWPTKLGHMGPAFCNRTWLFDPEKIRPIEDKLEQVWVNIFGGTSLYSLWAHEWNKHGTCAAALDKFNSELKYFSVGLDWLSNYSMFQTLQSKNIVPSNSQQYSVKDIYNAVKDKLGVDPVLECKIEEGQSYISEIRICFTKDLKNVDCDGVITYNRKNIEGQSILTNCHTDNIIYPHYMKKNSLYIQLYHLISWLQWFTL